MSFDSLGLSVELLRALETQGYSEPTPIQAKAIPVVLQGGDVLAAAQTGTGKTAGFTLPLLQRLVEAGQTDNRPNQPRALILEQREADIGTKSVYFDAWRGRSAQSRQRSTMGESKTALSPR